MPIKFRATEEGYAIISRIELAPPSASIKMTHSSSCAKPDTKPKATVAVIILCTVFFQLCQFLSGCLFHYVSECFVCVSLSPFGACRLITIIILYYPHHTLIYSIYDSTEVAIQKMIEASQRMLRMNSQGELGGMSPPLKKHLELEIKILENAPRDADKLRRLLQIKQRQKEGADHIEDTKRLVTEEIEMLKVV